MGTGFENKDNFEIALSNYDADGDNQISLNEFAAFCKATIARGQHREVVLKFMKNETQFKNEILFRDELKDSPVVVEITQEYNSQENEEFESAATSYNLTSTNVKHDSYQFALEMTCADRNLHTIHLSEQLDMNTIIDYTSQLANALQKLHEKDIIHGDVKLSNIVRVGGTIKLIDLDASANINSSYKDASTFAGKKFSSGVLPPEMIYKLKDINKE